MKPKKNNKSSKKKITPTIPIDNGGNFIPPKIGEMPPQDLEFIKKLLSEIKVNSAVDNKKLIDDANIDIIKNILSEYFNCFALIGYDINGKRVVCKWTASDQHEDSLIELLRCVFMNIVNNTYNH